MRFTAILILGMLAPVLPTQCKDGKKIWTDKNEVWVETAAGSRQLTNDGIPKRLAALSPGGNRLVYVVDDWSSDAQHKQPPKEEVVEMDSNGRLLRHIVPKGYVPEQFEQLEWIDSYRVGAMTCGHANCMYWIIDADSGKTLQVMQGGFDFIWSHNRQWVARRLVDFLDAPLGTPKDELDQLMLNERSVYPPKGGGRRRCPNAGGSQASSWTQLRAVFVVATRRMVSIYGYGDPRRRPVCCVGESCG
jgi:hypothetical protein